MDMIIIAYWTQTGNTKAMAEAVGEEISRYAYAAYLYENEKKEEKYFFL